MKVKLLRKVRKRYSITHYPNGVYLHGELLDGPITFISDKENVYRLKRDIGNKETAYANLYEILLDWIQTDYGPSKRKIKNRTAEQLWYKK